MEQLTLTNCSSGTTTITGKQFSSDHLCPYLYSGTSDKDFLNKGHIPRSQMLTVLYCYRSLYNPCNAVIMEVIF